MGSIHSTRWKGYKRKPLVEECFLIDAGNIKEALRFDDIVIDDEFEEEANEDNSKDLLAYYEEVNATILLTKTPQHLGGFRWWFRCLNCQRRVGKLYLLDNMLKCRLCHNLTYRSCRESHTLSPVDKMDYFYKKCFGIPMPKEQRHCLNVLLHNESLLPQH